MAIALDGAASETAPTEPSAPSNLEPESGAGGEQSLALAAEPTPDSEEATTPAPPEAPLSEDNPLVRAALFQTVTPLPDIEQLRRLPSLYQRRLRALSGAAANKRDGKNHVAGTSDR